MTQMPFTESRVERVESIVKIITNYAEFYIIEVALQMFVIITLHFESNFVGCNC